MPADRFGPWRPLPVADAVALFAGAQFRWWVSGGHALELYCGHAWRDHNDTDIGILRADTHRLRMVLPGWDIAVAAAGTLTPWDGHPLLAPRHENNLWCRPDPTSPWALDITIGDGDENHWRYRRDPSLHRPWNLAVSHTNDGVPYLAPDLQLLFKSKDLRPKDTLDAQHVTPLLDMPARTFLRARLPMDHPWQALVNPAPLEPSDPAGRPAADVLSSPADQPTTAIP